ncbi:MAG: hypothetical protein ABIP48_26890 [Planctomycetota bacterium]
MIRHADQEQTPFTRRRFLRAAAAATAVPTIVSAAALGKDNQSAPSERITLGMIGAGDRAGQLATHLLAMPDAQIVAVCDPSQQKRQGLKNRVEEARTQCPADTRDSALTTIQSHEWPPRDKKEESTSRAVGTAGFARARP